MTPIHKDKDKWYFWDEIGVYRFGPYVSQEDTEEALDLYCDYLNGHKDKERADRFKYLLEKGKDND